MKEGIRLKEIAAWIEKPVQEIDIMLWRNIHNASTFRTNFP